MSLTGILNVLKPPGMTSHDVVNFVRKLYQVKKVGHTGTLDPAAAGVLPVCVGRATKVAQYITGFDKKYRAEITLGITTDTLDGEGEVQRVKDASHITKEMFVQALGNFIGDIEQVPPMASAVKIGGKKLYELKRAGIDVARPARQVKIYDIRHIWSCGWGTNHPRALLDITCSKGTYIRTLCQDIGEHLGVGAYMSFLLRLKSGPFEISKSWTLEELAQCSEGQKALMDIDSALQAFPAVTVKDRAVKSVISGAKLYPPGVAEQPVDLISGSLVRLKNKGELLALAEVQYEHHEHRTVYKPVCIIKTNR